jgi:hypothetical protein
MIRTTPELEKTIIKDYQNLSYQKLSEKYNFSIPTIKKILNKNNIKKLKKSRVNMSRVKLKINYFSNIDTPKKAYWLGYICGDGAINKNNNKISLTSKDYLIIKRFKDDINSGHKISKIETTDKRTKKVYIRYLIQITNELFTKHIINMGITNNKSYDLNFPKIDKKYYRYFIAGLFDSDGSLQLKNNKIRCDLITTKEMIDFIKEHLKDFDIKTNSYFSVSNNGMNVYRVHWYSDSMRFLNYIYGDNNFNYLERKYDIYLNALKYGIKSRFKKVQQYDIDLNLIRTWNNAKELSVHIRTPYTTLRKLIKDEKIHKKYIWKYEK